ncbi:MAG: formate dehydrogenase subunit alpha [Anaerolineaceae bacterium]|nr:formate dehydrogenase subunit alpha [Anaerolineaceae bacterium]
MVTFTINGKIIETESGNTVLKAARENNILIPTLCDHPDLTPHGGCRLCNVEIKGARSLLAACTLPVSDGMEVFTESETLTESRKSILTLLLSNYYSNGSRSNKPNELIYWANKYNVDFKEYSRKTPRYEIDQDPSPVIRVDLNQCILCTRCIRACNEIQGRFVWGLTERGFETHITAGDDVTMQEARCESCGACVVYCPTGALESRISLNHEEPDRLVQTTCAYCGIGCNFDVNIKDDKVVGVTSTPNAAVNGLHLCVKGRYGHQFIHHPDRLTQPWVREYLLKGKPRPSTTDRGPWVKTDWETALDLVAKKLVETKLTHGANSIGVLTSAKCTNEENYLMNKFSRQVIGTHNIDHCARLCHSSTVAGLATAFGSGAMTNTIADIYDFAKAIFIIGSNTTEQHPIIGAKIRQAVRQKQTKLIVADPRKIDITEFATIHLQHKPGTDIPLINGLMNILINNNQHDKEFIQSRCDNFDEFSETIQHFSPTYVSRITGVPETKLYQAANLIAENHPMAVFWAMGITQHTTGVMNVFSLANLQMLMGNMGIPGGGVNPLRGQNNVQGACDMGGLPDVFPGYQKVVSEETRKKFQDAWLLTNSSNNLFPDKPGLTVTEMIHGAETGQIRALYIMAEDPMMTDPDINHVKKCLNACEFTVLQEIFPSETAEYADVLLPGSTFVEKDGTFTNTERRVQLVNKAIPNIGESKADWEITSELARRLLTIENRQPIGPLSNWDFTSAAQVMDEIAALTPSYAGINFTRLKNGEQLHWPVKHKEHPGTPILHIGQFTRGKGIFHVTEHLPPQELPDEEYPFTLTTGRVLYHWHGGEMTRRSQSLLDIYPEALIEISAEDALQFGITDESQIKVNSRRGEVIAKAYITKRVSPGLIFANFHFPGDQNVNNLTIAALDPVAKIPEYKVCAVNIKAIS